MQRVCTALLALGIVGCGDAPPGVGDTAQHQRALGEALPTYVDLEEGESTTFTTVDSVSHTVTLVSQSLDEVEVEVDGARSTFDLNQDRCGSPNHLVPRNVSGVLVVPEIVSDIQNGCGEWNKDWRARRMMVAWETGDIVEDRDVENPGYARLLLLDPAKSLVAGAFPVVTGSCEDMLDAVWRPYLVSSSYGIHHGVDLQAPVGTGLKAPLGGTLLVVERNCPIGDTSCHHGCGNMIRVEGNDYKYYFCHMGEVEASLEVGGTVLAGQDVGTIDMTGLTGGTPHLHFTFHSKSGFPEPYPMVNPWPFLDRWCKGVEGCTAGTADCNADPNDGCEIDTTSDPAHCGGCGQVCNLTNAIESCLNNVCGIAVCDAGFADCNTLPTDGCEINTASDPAHCGACNQACNLGHATGVCASGSCEIDTCDAGFGDCNADPADGCEVDTDSDPSHCGACGQACNLDHATEVCTRGSCEMDACDAGFGDCNASPADGCEVDLTSNADHCGSCGTACLATQVCEQAVCTIDCSPGRIICSGACVDPETDTSHCGTCYHACPPDHSCVSGLCSANGCPDADGDGHLDAACGGADCDDSDAAISTDAQEICGDGIDNNCSGSDLPCSPLIVGACSAAGANSAPGLICWLALAGIVRRWRDRFR